jgi:hypothetical protein
VNVEDPVAVKVWMVSPPNEVTVPPVAIGGPGYLMIMIPEPPDEKVGLLVLEPPPPPPVLYE